MNTRHKASDDGAVAGDELLRKRSVPRGVAQSKRLCVPSNVESFENQSLEKSMDDWRARVQEGHGGNVEIC